MRARNDEAKDELVLRQLVQLARGDLALVNEAIRATRRDDAKIDISAVVEYIQRHLAARATPVSMPAAVIAALHEEKHL